MWAVGRRFEKIIANFIEFSMTGSRPSARLRTDLLSEWSESLGIPEEDLLSGVPGLFRFLDTRILSTFVQSVQMPDDVMPGHSAVVFRMPTRDPESPAKTQVVLAGPDGRILARRAFDFDELQGLLPGFYDFVADGKGGLIFRNGTVRFDGGRVLFEKGRLPEEWRKSLRKVMAGNAEGIRLRLLQADGGELEYAPSRTIGDAVLAGGEIIARPTVPTGGMQPSGASSGWRMKLPENFFFNHRLI